MYGHILKALLCVAVVVLAVGRVEAQDPPGKSLAHGPTGTLWSRMFEADPEMWELPSWKTREAHPGMFRGGPWAKTGWVRVYGWLTQGTVLNCASPKDRRNTPLGFNDRSNAYMLNQLYLVIDRPTGADPDKWDFGGRVDLFFGTDWFYTGAFGLANDARGRPKWNSEKALRNGGGPATTVAAGQTAALYGLSMPQAYVELYMPLLKGMRLKGGHFYSPLGYERVAGPENFFYTHTYAMMYGQPRTFTGFLFSVDLPAGFTIHSGMTGGWNTWKDNNDDHGYLGGVEWRSKDDRVAFSYMTHVSREPNRTTNDWMYVHTVVASVEPIEKLTAAVEWTYGQFNNAVAQTNQDAEWCGLAAYVIYEINKQWSVGARYEWFSDDDGVRVLGNGTNGVPTHWKDFTIGVNWRPYEHVTIRAEMRWDCADPLISAPGGPFDDSNHNYQRTFGISAVISF